MNRFVSFLTLFTAASLVLGLTGAVARAADAPTPGGVCIAEKSKEALNACGGTGPAQFDVSKHGKAPQVNFKTAPPPAELKKRDQQTKPGNPNELMGSASRDERKNKLQSRARALLVTEISGLENLFGSTPKNSPDRVDLARRLAEDYVELESAAFREKTQAEVDRDSLKKTNPAAAGQKQTVAQQANTIMGRARVQAEKYYGVITNEYPNYRLLDEVLYYLAYEYEQANENDKARKVYFQLIQTRPNSKYIPNAYLAFGELFFNEAQGDPSKWDTAAQAYMQVIKYPPPDNKVYGYAWYKLAYVFWNEGDFPKALNAFKKTIDYGVTYAQLPNATKLAEGARRDIIPVYALRGDPSAAYNFFHNLSGDQSGENVHTFGMMDDLGQNYLDTGHYPEAIALYKDLEARDRNSEKSCVYQAHITEATMAMKSGNKDLIKVELDNQSKVYNEFKNSNHKPDSKQECANKTAALLVETAMAWHLEAVGPAGQRGTGDPKTMGLAAYFYKRVADTWNAQEFSKFEFPRIVKEDWPTIYKIKYDMADLLYFQQRWNDCGPAFDAVVAENPQAPEAAEAAYASVLCYQNIYEQTHANGEDRKGGGNGPGQGEGKKSKDSKSDDERLAPKQFTDNQKGMLSAFNRYICYIHPAAGDQAGQDQLTEVKYARARTYFEAQHWEEAGTAFRDIAMNFSDKDVGIYAAQLYLESVNVLGAHSNPPRPACFDDMAADVPKFIELYCTGDKLAKNQEQCTNLTKIQCDIQRIKAEKIVQLADKQGGTAALGLYEQAGNAAYELWRKYGEAPLSQNQPPTCDKLDEVVYNAARYYQAGRLIAKAIRARMTLLNPQFRMDQSPLAKKATLEIGKNYQAIAVYDMASDWYEKYAKADKTAAGADQALADATVLRIELGQEDEAIADSKLFMRNYGAAKPEQTASIAYAIGAHYAEKEDWDKAKAALTGSMGVINKAAPDIQIQAHANLAKAYTHAKGGGADAQAKAEYAKVRALWQNPQDAIARINAAYSGEDQGSREKRIGKAVTAVGEAYFYAADALKKTEVDNIKFPEYHGPGTKADVLKHVQTKVAAWLQKKKPAIEKVAGEYKKILDLQPDAPPRWVIAAGSRVGLMWGNFVDEFRAAPIPADWKKDPELRGVYYDALDGASEPIKSGRAKPALVTCLAYSVKFEYFDEFSRSCEVWLAKNYKAEFHVVDELRPSPTLSNGGLDDKPPPLLVGGQAWHPAQVVAAGEKQEKAGTDSSSSSDDDSQPTKKAAKPKKKKH
ncbi:MAG: tetratricopeptide repeat protein [Polyangiaceae bacterium]